MAQNLILLPVFAQVALVLIVGAIMGVRRHRSLAAAGRDLQAAATADDRDWAAPAERASRNFKNQFEMPVLFYAVCAFALITRTVDLAQFVLAWVFVVSRAAHALSHLTTNIVMVRGSLYLIGVGALTLMWLVLAIHVIGAGF